MSSSEEETRNSKSVSGEIGVRDKEKAEGYSPEDGADYEEYEAQGEAQTAGSLDQAVQEELNSWKEQSPEERPTQDQEDKNPYDYPQGEEAQEIPEGYENFSEEPVTQEIGMPKPETRTTQSQTDQDGFRAVKSEEYVYDFFSGRDRLSPEEQETLDSMRKGKFDAGVQSIDELEDKVAADFAREEVKRLNQNPGLIHTIGMTVKDITEQTGNAILAGYIDARSEEGNVDEINSALSYGSERLRQYGTMKMVQAVDAMVKRGDTEEMDRFFGMFGGTENRMVQQALRESVKDYLQERMNDDNLQDFGQTLRNLREVFDTSLTVGARPRITYTRKETGDKAESRISLDERDLEDPIRGSVGASMANYAFKARERFSEELILNPELWDERFILSEKFARLTEIFKFAEKVFEERGVTESLEGEEVFDEEYYKIPYASLLDTVAKHQGSKARTGQQGLVGRMFELIQGAEDVEHFQLLETSMQLYSLGEYEKASVLARKLEDSVWPERMWKHVTQEYFAQADEGEEEQFASMGMTREEIEKEIKEKKDRREITDDQMRTFGDNLGVPGYMIDSVIAIRNGELWQAAQIAKEQAGGALPAIAKEIIPRARDKYQSGELPEDVFTGVAGKLGEEYEAEAWETVYVTTLADRREDSNFLEAIRPALEAARLGNERPSERLFQEAKTCFATGGLEDKTDENERVTESLFVRLGEQLGRKEEASFYASEVYRESAQEGGSDFLLIRALQHAMNAGEKGKEQISRIREYVERWNEAEMKDSTVRSICSLLDDQMLGRKVIAKRKIENSKIEVRETGSYELFYGAIEEAKGAGDYADELLGNIFEYAFEDAETRKDLEWPQVESLLQLSRDTRNEKPGNRRLVSILSERGRYNEAATLARDSEDEQSIAMAYDSSRRAFEQGMMNPDEFVHTISEKLGLEDEAARQVAGILYEESSQDPYKLPEMMGYAMVAGDKCTALKDMALRKVSRLESSIDVSIVTKTFRKAGQEEKGQKVAALRMMARAEEEIKQGNYKSLIEAATYAKNSGADADGLKEQILGMVKNSYSRLELAVEYPEDEVRIANTERDLLELAGRLQEEGEKYVQEISRDIAEKNFGERRFCYVAEHAARTQDQEYMDRMFTKLGTICRIDFQEKLIPYETWKGIGKRLGHEREAEEIYQFKRREAEERLRDTEGEDVVIRPE